MACRVPRTPRKGGFNACTRASASFCQPLYPPGSSVLGIRLGWRNYEDIQPRKIAFRSGLAARPPSLVLVRKLDIGMAYAIVPRECVCTAE